VKLTGARRRRRRRRRRRKKRRRINVDGVGVVSEPPCLGPMSSTMAEMSSSAAPPYSRFSRASTHMRRAAASGFVYPFSDLMGGAYTGPYASST
jgi:hypothetical protein